MICPAAHSRLYRRYCVMTLLSDSPVIRQQLAHRSIRKFRDDVIPLELLQQLIRCGQAGASSSFVQAYSVIRVTQAAARARIAEAAGGQIYVEKAPEFLVFCADLKRIDLLSQKQGSGEVEGYTEHTVMAVVDVSLMAQNVMLAAESVGLGGVFIGGIRNNPDVVAEELQLPELVMPVFGMCLGVPDQDPQTKPRLPLEAVLHTDRYQQEEMEGLVQGYDEQMRVYYESRSSNARGDSWTAATARAVQNKTREHMKDFLQERGFNRR